MRFLKRLQAHEVGGAATRRFAALSAQKQPHFLRKSAQKSRCKKKAAAFPF
jgi:hypothetical protein